MNLDHVTKKFGSKLTVNLLPNKRADPPNGQGPNKRAPEGASIMPANAHDARVQ